MDHRITTTSGSDETTRSGGRRLPRRRAILRGGLISILVAGTLALSAAPAWAADPWSVTVSPNFVIAGTTRTYTATVTNLGGGSANKIGCVLISIPVGFVGSGSPTVVASNGRRWSAGRLGTAVWARANSNGDRLLGGSSPAERVTLTFSEVAPSPVLQTAYTWTTSTSSDLACASAGPVPSGGQPIVTVRPNTAPAAPAISAPANGASIAQTKPLLDWVDAVDAEGDTVTYEAQLDGSGCAFPSPEISTSGQPASSLTPGSALADGTYCWRVRATDRFGLVGPYGGPWTFTVDTVAPPAPSITSAPPATTTSTSASIAFSDAEGGTTFQCRLDGAAWGTCASPASYTGLAAGAHLFEVRALDAAGNVSPVTSASWTVQMQIDLWLGDGTTSPAWGDLGAPLTYTFVATNDGPVDATSVVVTDSLPAGVVLASATSTQGACAGDPVVVCSLGTIPNGGSVTVRVKVFPTVAGSLTNGASVASATGDVDMTNNDVSETTRVWSYGSTVDACTIVGTPGPDVLLGTAGDDVVCGLGGDDALQGLGGKDVLVGGPGADQLVGGDGNDKMAGGPGVDVLIGNGGGDSASYFDAPAGAVVNLVLGVASDDGYGTTDTLTSIRDVGGSNRGDDRLTGSGTKNILTGWAGDDVLTGMSGGDYLRAGPGDDTTQGGDGDDWLYGGPHTDDCTGGPGNDTGSSCETETGIP